MKHVIEFIKKETVLVAAIVLSLVSIFAVPFDKEYAGYIDWRTLGLLFGLMVVMAGFQKMGFFRMTGEWLLGKVKGMKGIILVLVFLCYFFAMVITNDVALITFVPFAITVLKLAGKEEKICFVVVMQTIAANMGSMLTPIGNPQNLYLYGEMRTTVVEFVKIMLPVTLTAGVLLVFIILFLGKEETKTDFQVTQKSENNLKISDVIFYSVLFVLCILSVAKILDYRIMVAIIAVALLIKDRKLFVKVDYSLLFTFIGFFVFIGNMGRIEVFREFIQKILQGHECITAVWVSQIVSNVPAALLLSGFTNEWEELVQGINIGGLGTLIASMASLISYKFIVREYPEKKGMYFKQFTLWSIVFLAALLGVKYLF